MQRIALIHTVPTVYATFAQRIRERIPDVKISNTVDEFLASDPAEVGEFTANNAARLFQIVKVAEATGADVVLTTCSTLSPHVEKLRPFAAVPLITIDGAMLAEAVSIGTRIAVIATADSTLGPTTDTLRREAAATGASIEVTAVLCPQAYTAIKARDRATHDRVVLARVPEVADHDVIVLAQASMAHLESEINTVTGKPVLSSPRMCIAELERVLAR